MSITVEAGDPRLSWRGAVSLERGHGWVKAWRIPFDDRILFQEDLRERAAMAAGVRLAFRTDATSIGGTVEAEPEPASVDLVIGDQLVATRPVAGRDAFRFDDVPPGDKEVELWLPQFGECRLYALQLNDGATLEPAEDTRPKWITYGSSITHCRTAASPALTWPAVVARGRGLDLTCLGYGGNCHLDPLVARIMRDRPADYLSMKVGINIYGAASLSPRTFAPGIVAFVQIVREKHPDTPFVVISPIISPPRETAANAVGFTLRGMREAVAGAVEALRAHGDRHVHYVDGMTLFGPDLLPFLPDDLHPNAEGYQAMGQNFLREVAARYFGT
ncbi:MAG TPA: SGNH/GDSL hydrolase family protein [Chloroflexota bacterium]|jgi:lysophospholipase L1-like esterase|nr:SGNH/GDSL hydrolase family protein [Chloroflexota bacterium]